MCTSAKTCAGACAEHWHHTGYGCRQWLVVERDTVSHEIFAVTAASKWKGPSAPAARKATSRKAPARKTPVRKAASRKTAGRAKS